MMMESSLTTTTTTPVDVTCTSRRNLLHDHNSTFSTSHNLCRSFSNKYKAPAPLLLAPPSTVEEGEADKELLFLQDKSLANKKKSKATQHRQSKHHGSLPASVVIIRAATPTLKEPSLPPASIYELLAQDNDEEEPHNDKAPLCLLDVFVEPSHDGALRMTAAEVCDLIPTMTHCTFCLDFVCAQNPPRHPVTRTRNPDVAQRRVEQHACQMQQEAEQTREKQVKCDDTSSMTTSHTSVAMGDDGNHNNSLAVLVLPPPNRDSTVIPFVATHVLPSQQPPVKAFQLFILRDGPQIRHQFHIPESNHNIDKKARYHVVVDNGQGSFRLCLNVNQVLDYVKEQTPDQCLFWLRLLNRDNNGYIQTCDPNLVVALLIQDSLQLQPLTSAEKVAQRVATAWQRAVCGKHHKNAAATTTSAVVV